MFRIESGVRISRNHGVLDSRRCGNEGNKPTLMNYARGSIAVAMLMLLALSGCSSGGSDAIPSDGTPPKVEYSYPDPAKGDIYSSNIQVTGIYVIFDEAVDAGTINNTNFTVVDNTSGGASVNGTVSYDASIRTAKFMPTNPLTALFIYTATVTTGVRDLAGNHLVTPYTWQFTIAPELDVTPPTVVSFYPDPANGNVSSSDIQTNGIYVVFDESVKDTTITNTNFTVVDDTSGGAPVNGTVSYGVVTRTAMFRPTNPLTALFNYTATVTTGVQDLAGNHLAAPYTKQFTVAGPTPPPPPP